MILCGFDNDRKSYHLPRNSIEPSEHLQSLIFPEIEAFLAANEDEVDDTPARTGFIKTLKWFRIVILQDSVILKERFPSWFVWKHPVFHSAEYKTFADQLKRSIISSETPAEHVLKQLAPAIMENIRVGNADLSSKLTSALVRSASDVTATIIVEGQSSRRAQSRFFSSLSEELSTCFRRIATTTSHENENMPSINDVFFGNYSVNQHLKRRRNENEASAELQSGDDMASETSHDSLDELEPPQHKMSRCVKTVKDLWREFYCGLGDGPAIITLEARWGTKWRQSEAESRFFQRRYKIISEINKLVTEGRFHSAEAAVEYMNNYQSTHKMSLHKLSAQISQGEL